MPILSSAIELNNLRLAFSALGLTGELWNELRHDLGFAGVAGRTLLLPHILRGRRGPPAAAVFPPFVPRAVPGLSGKRVGVVVSGGAGATASLVGVQRAFEEAGIVPAILSACSGAALFGSLWAAGLSSDEVARFWLGLRDRDYIDPDWLGLARGVARGLRGWGGVLRGDALEHTFWNRLGDLRLGDTRFPFSAVVWNIDENRVEHVGTRETPELPIARAARVAVSIPLLFPPVPLAGHIYGDGGIVDIFPATPVMAEEPPLDWVLGLNCYYAEDFLGEDVSGFMERTFSVVRASGQLRWAAHLEVARERVRQLGARLTLLHPVPYEETRGIKFYRGFLDRSEWPRVMRLGYEAARAAIDGWGAARPRLMPVRAVRAEPVPPVDAAWLRMEQPESPMTITSAMFFDGALDHERLLDVVGRAAQAFPRFHQRIERVSPTRHVWQPIAHLDLARHVTRVRLPAPGGEAELRALIGGLASLPLDRDRPLWHMHHIEGFGDRSAVVIRVSHAVGDGAAFMKVLTSLAEGAAPPPAPPGPVIRPGELGHHEIEALRAFGHLIAAPADPDTSLRAPLGVDKRVAWSDALPAPLLQAIARGAGATTNDVLLAALAGALRRLLGDRSEKTRGLTLHAIVPVNLRDEAPDVSLGNRFGLVFAPLPVGVADPMARLTEVAGAMAAIKRSPEAALALLTLAALGATNPVLHERAVRFFGGKATAVVTSVRGPSEPVALAGRRVAGMVFWAPLSARVGLGVSILRYRDEIRVGVESDARVCAEPQSIVSALAQEIDVLAAPGAVRRSPIHRPPARA